MANVTGMQIHVIGGAVRGFEHGEILPLQMQFLRNPSETENRNDKICRIRVQCPELAQIEATATLEPRRKEGIEQVITLFIKEAVVGCEELLELCDRVFEPSPVLIVDHNRPRELAEGLAFHADRGSE